MLKRILSALLLVALTYAFAACGGETGEPVSSDISVGGESSDTATPSVEESGEEINSTSDGEESEGTVGRLQPPEGVNVVYANDIERYDWIDLDEPNYYPDVLINATLKKVIEKHGKDAVYCAFITTDSTEYYEYKKAFAKTKLDSIKFGNGESGINKYEFTPDELREGLGWMIENDYNTFKELGMEVELKWAFDMTRQTVYAPAAPPFPNNQGYEYGFMLYETGEKLLAYMDALTQNRLDGDPKPYAHGGRFYLLTKELSEASHFMSYNIHFGSSSNQ